MPMARGRVLTTLASDFDSTKIVNMGGTIGTITQDRLTAVMGKMGPAPAMIPVDLSFTTPERREKVQHGNDFRPQADAAAGGSGLVQWR